MLNVKVWLNVFYAVKVNILSHFERKYNKKTELIDMQEKRELARYYQDIVLGKKKMTHKYENHKNIDIFLQLEAASMR